MTSENERKVAAILNLPVTRANHGIDNDRKETHANLTGMGDFNCEAEIDLSPRGDLSCTRTIFYSFFSYPFCPFLPTLFDTQNVSAFSTELRKHLSSLCHIALKATEMEYKIQRVSEIFRYTFVPRLNLYFYSAERRHRFLFSGS